MRPRSPGGGLVAYAKRQAWLGFLAIGILGLIFGAYSYVLAQPLEPETFARITGVSWEEAQQSLPGMAEYVSIIVQSQAQFMLAFGALVVALAAVPYRKGEAWAWYALWVVPILLITLGLRVFLLGAMGWTLIAFQLVLALGALLLPYRIFFPHLRNEEALKGGRADVEEA